MAGENVTLQGNPVTLTGDPVEVGDPAPDFSAVANDLSPVRFSEFAKGRVVVLATVPSLDTLVCEMETRRFNEEAAKLPGNVSVLVVSMDLPFAQKRWVEEKGVGNLATWSDHREAECGRKYGVLLEGLRLLARVVFVVDAGGVVRYKQVVPEIAEEPDYAEVINAASSLL